MTETWLQPNDYCFIPSGYQIFREDRELHGGGVAIILNSSFKCNKMELNNVNLITPSNLEILCMSVQCNFNKSFVICVIYRTGPILGDLDNFDKLFNYFSTLNKRVVLCGDININLMGDSGCAKLFMNQCKKYNFSQIVNSPTRGNNLLDVIITNSKDCNISSVVDPSISDHQMTLCTLSYAKKTVLQKEIQFRNFNSINWETFIDQVDRFSINEHDTTIFTHDMISVILSLFDLHSPKITKKVRVKKNSNTLF